MAEFKVQAIHSLPETASPLDRIEGNLEIVLPQSCSCEVVYFWKTWTSLGISETIKYIPKVHISDWD